MLTFTVHEPPDPPADRIDRAEKLVFVKDGFSWAAALFGPLWMIFHRLWWALLGFVLIAGGLQLSACSSPRTSAGSGSPVSPSIFSSAWRRTRCSAGRSIVAAGIFWAPSRDATTPNASAASSRPGCRRNRS